MKTTKKLIVTVSFILFALIGFNSEAKAQSAIQMVTDNVITPKPNSPNRAKYSGNANKIKKNRKARKVYQISRFECQGYGNYFSKKSKERKKLMSKNRKKRKSAFAMK